VSVDFPTLYTERLALRGLDPDDKQAIFDLYSNEEVTRYYDLSTLTALVQAEKLIDYFIGRYKAHQGMRWAIVNKSTHKVIGTCGFNSWTPKYHSASIGYEIHPEHWGKGFANEALSRMIDYAFSKGLGFQVNRIQSLITPSNERGIHMAEKLGFQLEGLLREYGYWKAKPQDVYSYSLLRRDLNFRNIVKSEDFERIALDVEPEKKSMMSRLFNRKK
jgi:[ribosomal protein S5]-alanine N-acetyltransferase